MLTVRGVYDGQKVHLLQQVAVKKPHEVLVSFPDLPENGEAEEDSVAEKFDRFFEKWYEETAPISGSAIFTNPNHQKMIDLGEAAIPLMLKKLQEKPHFLFRALAKISGENPVLKEHHGKFDLIIEDWLNWGKQKGFVQ